MVAWAAAATSVASAGQVAPCNFNAMCSCKFGGEGGETREIHLTTPKSLDDVRDISCVGVPFGKLPELPGGPISHMDVVNSGLEALENEALAGAKVESLRLMSNRIMHVGERAFGSASDALKSLDLSYNELDEIPFEALQSLRSLDWLNFHSNHIASVGKISDWGSLRESLTNLFLGENDLAELEAGDAIASLPRLAWLNVDANQLRELPQGSLPGSLQTLSASHNLLEKFPSSAIAPLKGLTWIFLRGNHIDSLPDTSLDPNTRHRLEKLDLGENFLLTLPSPVFNGSVAVRDLNLDGNHLRTIPAQAFRGTNAGRIYLSLNRLESLDERAFLGLGHTLEFLDLEGNRLTAIPKALGHLRRLKYLYLPGNKIRDVPADSFSAFAHAIRALSLSANRLENVPRAALAECRRMSHLNLGYNRISEVSEADFAKWGASLDTLLLRSNHITRLGPNAFRGAPRLRELSLSFNRIVTLDPEAFVDAAASLESLEISSGLRRDDFPAEALRPLASLLWLALDGNEFRTVLPTALYPFTKLKYLNLDGNRFRSLPQRLFDGAVHRKLSDIRLSRNRLVSLEEDTFSGLPELQTIVLSGNGLRNVAAGTFRNLPSLLTLFISDNRLNSFPPRTFSHLPSLVRLDAQRNDLRELSLGAFYNVTGPIVPLALNISQNRIATLHPGDTAGVLNVKSVDASHNRLSEVPIDFLQPLSASLRRLHLAFNRIARLDAGAFGELPRLQVLTLQHNGLASIKRGAFEGLTELQTLDLSHNHLEALALEQFARLPFLRILDLSHNHIRSLPRDAFQGAPLERLDLSGNEFVSLPIGALGEVGRTLRHLDVSRNRLEHLDGTMLSQTPHLLSLGLAANRLTILPDNAFAALGALLRLDLSSNPLRANFKELFHYLPTLRTLSLAGCGLSGSAPSLRLPALLNLDLSDNTLEDVSSSSAAGVPRLRILTLTRNKFTSLPSSAWPMLPRLRALDISENPIRVVTKDSLSPLPRLQSLLMQGLARMERFDSDSFSMLKRLTTVKVQTFPRIEKYRFRLGSVLSGAPSIRRLSVHVLEPLLADQLLRAFSPKLRELEVTGEDLKAVAPEALDAVSEEGNLELAFALRGTSVSSLPPGLLAGLAAAVPHLSIDLSDNRFAALGPAALYPNDSSWENVGTRIVSGGLVLRGNPWSCGCELAWLGAWLRRWLRETLQIHTVSVEGAQRARHRLAREATCVHPRTAARVPLIDLRPEDVGGGCRDAAEGDGGAGGDDAAPLSGEASAPALCAVPRRRAHDALGWWWFWFFWWDGPPGPAVAIASLAAWRWWW
ncbi:chaoptin-like [Hetaerina americana]|uniref:chaoptin-like n=1 Tax=Hetaerina americana TaxID=62018 RepID=UPI003A7F25A0